MTPARAAALATREAVARIRTDLVDSKNSFVLDGEFVADTARRLDQSGVIEQVEQWAAEDSKGPGGRPELFPKRALLVVMFCCARLGRPMLVTEWQQLIRSMPEPDRAALRLPGPPPAASRSRHNAYYRNLRTRFHAIERLMDFSALPKNRRFTPEAMLNRMRELTPERVEVLRERQTWFVNRVLRISHRAMPKELWDLWEGGMAVDATPLATFARHPKRSNRPARTGSREILIHSADPDAAWYVRQGDHADVERLADGSHPDKLIYGYEHTHVYLGASSKDERGLYPKVLLAMALPHVPGESPGRNGFRAVSLANSAAREAGVRGRHLIGDNAYVNAHAEDFAVPIRALGLDLVIDYNAKQLEVQAGHDGALMVEGKWYCPAMPKPLIEATTDFRNEVIDYGTYQRRLNDRLAFAFRPKAKPDRDGNLRLLCPAAGAAPTARCDHKPASRDRHHLGKRRVDLNHLLRKSPPKACTQQSITIPAIARGRFEQALHYGTEAWRVPYQTLRSTNEGGNGIVKDSAHQGLEDAGRRRIRGQAANALLTCFMLCAENLRVIGSWAIKAEPDANGVRRLRYHPRRSQNVSGTINRGESAAVGPPNVG